MTSLNGSFPLMIYTTIEVGSSLYPPLIRPLKSISNATAMTASTIQTKGPRNMRLTFITCLALGATQSARYRLRLASDAKSG